MISVTEACIMSHDHDPGPGPLSNYDPEVSDSPAKGKTQVIYGPPGRPSDSLRHSDSLAQRHSLGLWPGPGRRQPLWKLSSQNVL